MKSIQIRDRRIKTNVLIVKPNDNTNNVKTYTALIDTGSTDTLVRKNVISDLNLEPSGEKVYIKDSNGVEKESDRYSSYIQIEGMTKTYIPNVAELFREDLDVVIGMDILEKLEVKMDNFILYLTEK